MKQFVETEAIKHFSKAAQYFNIANNYRNEIISYNQIDDAYLMKSLNDSAFHYYRKGFELAEISNDILQMANITQCIGIAYRQTGDFDISIEFFRSAGKYVEDNDYRAKLYLNLSKTFHEKGIQDSAKLYVSKFLSIAKEEDLVLLDSIYKTLSQIYDKQRITTDY